MDISEYHQKARLANFPPNKRWAKVEGIIFFSHEETNRHWFPSVAATIKAKWLRSGPICPTQCT